MVRQVAEPIEKEIPGRFGNVPLGESALHAPEPLVPFPLTDAKRQVPHPEAGVTIALDVQLGTARPAGEEEEELLARNPEARRMERPDRGRLGRRIHQIVEPIHQPANAFLAAEEFEVRLHPRLHLSESLLTPADAGGVHVPGIVTAGATNPIRGISRTDLVTAESAPARSEEEDPFHGRTQEPARTILSSGRHGRPRGGRRATALARAFSLVLMLGLVGCGGDADDERNGAAAGVAEEAIVVPEPFVVPSPPARPRTVEEIFPDVGRRGLVLNNCASCHAVACVTLGQRTAEEWAAVEATHRDAIPGMSLEDFGKAFDYLKRHFNDTRPEPDIPAEWLNGDCAPANAERATATPLPDTAGD